MKQSWMALDKMQLAVWIGSTALCWFMLSFLVSRHQQRLIKKAPVNQERWAAQKSTLGGVVIFTGWALAWLCEVVFTSPLHYEGLAYAGMWGATAAFAGGLADDVFSIRPMHKLMLQFLAVAVFVVVALGSQPQLNAGTLWAMCLTYLVMMNSLNMLDNMDGVAATVALVALVVLGEGQWSTWGLAGGLLAFLWFNKRPARIYMGDSGSMFLGFVLGNGMLPIYSAGHHALWPALLLLPSLFVLPLADTAVVVINRLRQGLSPARGGRDHTTHHLVYAGVRESAVPWLLGAAEASGLAIGLLAYQFLLRGQAMKSIALSLFWFVLVFIALWLLTLRNMRLKKFSYK